jgi:hypothetical protein
MIDKTATIKRKSPLVIGVLFSLEPLVFIKLNRLGVLNELQF